jgi:hypothetical protein
MPRRLYLCENCGAGEDSWNYCFSCEACADCCECGDDLFDADELGLDPEDDAGRKYGEADA